MRKVITIVFFCSIVVTIPNLSIADSTTLNNGGTTTSQQNIDGNGESLLFGPIKRVSKHSHNDSIGQIELIVNPYFVV